MKIDRFHQTLVRKRKATTRDGEVSAALKPIHGHCVLTIGNKAPRIHGNDAIESRAICERRD